MSFVVRHVGLLRSYKLCKLKPFIVTVYTHEVSHGVISCLVNGQPGKNWEVGGLPKVSQFTPYTCPLLCSCMKAEFTFPAGSVLQAGVPCIGCQETRFMYANSWLCDPGQVK